MKFIAPGYVPKFLVMDTRNVTKADKVGGFGFDIDMTLFKSMDRSVIEFLDKEPIAIASYSKKTSSIGFDKVQLEMASKKLKALRGLE